MSDSSSNPNGPLTTDDGGKLRLQQVLSMLQESNAAANNNTNNSANVFCSSCDLCRSRKRKCDGERPCTTCILSYVKKNKANHVNYANLITEVKCVYSLAKKRGPPKRTEDNNSSSGSDEEEKNGKSRKKQTAPLLAQDISSPTAATVASASDSATAATSILNLLGMPNPTAALSRDLLQIRQADLGSMSVASLNQSFFPSVGSAQSASGHAALALQLQLLQQAHQIEVQQRQAQQLASLQNLVYPPQQSSKAQQQLQVQQGGLPSNSGAESSPALPSPSVEDGRLLLLQSQINMLQNKVDYLQSRMSCLEAENTILKQRFHLLRKIESDKATE